MNRFAFSHYLGKRIFHRGKVIGKVIDILVNQSGIYASVQLDTEITFEHIKPREGYFQIQLVDAEDFA